MGQRVPRSRVIVGGALAAVAAAALGFLIHVGTQAWVATWVSEHMAATAVKPSWDVRYLAFATSLEVGVALVVLYALVRRSMPGRSPAVRGMLLGLVLLAVMGRLVRQPVMDLAIGNPLAVVLVQDGVSWVLWLSISVVAAVLFERLVPSDEAPGGDAA